MLQQPETEFFCFRFVDKQVLGFVGRSFEMKVMSCKGLFDVVVEGCWAEKGHIFELVS